MASALKVVDKPLSKMSAEELADEFGECHRLLELWQPQVNPHAARYSEIYEELRARFGDYDPEKSKIVSGKRYQLEVTPCDNRRQVEADAMEAAFYAVRKVTSKIKTLELFGVFKATLGDLKTYLGEAWLDEYMPKKRSGPRDYRVTALSAPLPVKKVA